MTVKLLAIGRTDSRELRELVAVYTKRLAHYVNFEMESLPDIRNAGKLSQTRQLHLEGTALMNKIAPSDLVYLLDEKGKAFSSLEFAGFLQKQMNAGVRNFVLLIGGPYGFSPEIYTRAAGMISLSKMTFSHQMVRLFIVEQLYRAFTILRNEPYHHQ